jgi:cytochrome c-type biogenesis protein CcmH/NrfG
MAQKPQKLAKSRKANAARAEQATAVQLKKERAIIRKRIFTVAICIIVALGLMLPIAGYGAISCSSQPAQAGQENTGD